MMHHIHPIRSLLLRTLLLVAALTAAVGASAQHLPERGEVRRGNRQFHRGNYDRSIEHYEEALRTAPHNFEATYNLGNALYKAERYDKAEQTLRTAAADSLRTEQERAEAFYNLGNAQFAQKRYQEALESYKQSLRLNPSDQEAKYNYAYTKHLLDQQQQDQQQQDQQQQNQDQNQDQQQQQQSGGEGQGGDQQQNQNQNQTQDPQQQPGQQQPDEGEQQESDDEGPQGDGAAQPAGISPEEQARLLDAIQAQEDRTQEKLKERQGVVVRGTKNW